MLYDASPVILDVMIIFRGSRKEAERVKETIMKGENVYGKPDSIDLYNGGGLQSKDGPYMIAVKQKIGPDGEPAYKSYIEGLITNNKKLNLEKSSVLVPIFEK